ncbi:MAG: CCA tRNA nucleotidyltransferase [bacterium]|nr:CCA tRNA nucleotidyltransferase [bacterium]
MTREVNNTEQIPEPVQIVLQTLMKAGFEAYLVGGCVRDIKLHKKPKDWDITTNAVPENIIGLFPHTFYENTYGTVGVVIDESIDDSFKVIEVTPYRLETGYSDKRRPDQVVFSNTIKDDLKRRDFTINAIAFNPIDGKIIDLYKGQEDLSCKLLRTVGDAKERFQEDALRILRAVRLSTELGFAIEKSTEKALVDNSNLLGHISKERIRDEFIKIVMSDQPKKGIEVANQLGILRFISIDLEKGIGIDQGGVHTYDVWEHLLRSLQLTADKKWPLETRLAALFHDIGKPDTRRKTPGKDKWTFYGHEVVGARMTKKILTELRFPQKTIEKVVKLVRWHMFFSDTEQITPSAVRRLVVNVGKENIWDLMDVRVADRIGTGRPKESPYRLRKYHSMIDEVMRDPISVAMLNINGKRIMDVIRETPGPKIGFILHALLEEVIEDPQKNIAAYLEKRAGELAVLSLLELRIRGEKGKHLKDEEEKREVEEIRKKHFVD